MKGKNRWFLLIIILVVLGGFFLVKQTKLESPKSVSVGYDEAEREELFGDATDEEIDYALDVLIKDYAKRGEVEETPKITEEDIYRLNLEDIVNVDNLYKLQYELHRENAPKPKE